MKFYGIPELTQPLRTTTFARQPPPNPRPGHRSSPRQIASPCARCPASGEEDGRARDPLVAMGSSAVWPPDGVRDRPAPCSAPRASGRTRKRWVRATCPGGVTNGGVRRSPGRSSSQQHSNQLARQPPRLAGPLLGDQSQGPLGPVSARSSPPALPALGFGMRTSALYRYAPTLVVRGTRRGGRRDRERGP